MQTKNKANVTHRQHIAQPDPRVVLASMARGIQTMADFFSWQLETVAAMYEGTIDAKETNATASIGRNLLRTVEIVDRKKGKMLKDARLFEQSRQPQLTQ